MNRFSRVFLIVLDSVGIGELPDAKKFNDEGSHTLGHIAQKVDGFALPHLAELGLGTIAPLHNVPAVAAPRAHYGKMKEISMGKDTTTGHWEIMGLHVSTPFNTYPDGFPQELIEEFEQRIGRKVLGNKVASGTEILDELGEEHMKTGAVIVYTSADSVFQVAAHEEIVPLEELYKICEIARELTLRDEYAVTRVIARPFLGKPGAFERTSNRHDYSVKPFDNTVMNNLVEAGLTSIAIGKISDIYAGEGVSKEIRSKDNMDGVDKLLQSMQESFTGLSFVNLVDFDAKYGHRRDPEGYGKALMEFDARVPELLAALKENDLLIITADHGNDPTHHGTDHTREYVPILAYYKNLETGKNLGVRETFADLGATIAENFEVKMPKIGQSFLAQL
ncbi:MULTISPECIES: phosphopentomutase [Brevibacillus]|uniref:Phosphopentomutase n=1 Tax=Brevibacillus laterosporus LMG 15441 TaxID=1042163 RepID=A0A075R4G0_BRELA|nr:MULTISPECIES: phosphopentomutase [Brevibacillus]AIG26063.1 phosphopentomutase [Brevibacillus laterosporus LMG 15441]AUM64691.1 phosphopentomutase [Brevibacillus laterosporus]AYK07611.1 phosphopentomutase [Brevibacillus laterosporus]ERM20291.1 phosphopentomutase [Brevibacillus laterosporus PE36]MBA4535084.1 phosphopentomutase [Brevibacillus halotolerans]